MGKQSRLEILEQMGWGPKEIYELLDEIEKRIQDKKERFFPEASLERRTIELVNQIGVPYNLVGRNYVIEAVKIIYKKPVAKITHEVYYTVGKMFWVSESNVERSIAQVIENVCKSPMFFKIFEGIIENPHTKVTNSKFLHGLVYYLKEQEN